jgi:ribosomal protein L29
MPGDAHALADPPAPPVGHDWPGVGEATGPVGVLLSLVLILDRMGLLRRRPKSEQDDTAKTAAKTAAAVEQAQALAEVKKDVEHLLKRAEEDRADQRRHRRDVARILTGLQARIARELDNAPD